LVLQPTLERSDSFLDVDAKLNEFLSHLVIELLDTRPSRGAIRRSRTVIAYLQYDEEGEVLQVGEEMLVLGI